MPNQLYPSALPIPQADYSGKTSSNVVTTTFASGRPRRRRMGWGKYHIVKLSWQLSPEEFDFFIGWWEFTIDVGTLPFDISMATGGKFGVHSVQLMDDLDYNHLGYFWQITCNAVILVRPELTQDEVWLIEDMGRPAAPADFPGYEDRLDSLVNTQIPSYLGV